MTSANNVATLDVALAVPFEAAFEYIANPRNQPEWAIHFIRSVREVGGQLLATTPMGEVPLSVESDPWWGILDIRLGDGPTIPTRLIRNGNGCYYVFTLSQPPDMPDEVWNDVAMPNMREELAMLKTLLEQEVLSDERQQNACTHRDCRRVRGHHRGRHDRRDGHGAVRWSHVRPDVSEGPESGGTADAIPPRRLRYNRGRGGRLWHVAGRGLLLGFAVFLGGHLVVSGWSKMPVAPMTIAGLLDPLSVAVGAVAWAWTLRVRKETHVAQAS